MNDKNSTGSRAKRLGEIIRVFARYGLADWFTKIPDGRIGDFLIKPEQKAIAEKPPAERLRLALTDLGPTFIKLGQVS
jgi:ubiquinone biosynthesis protein